MNDVKQREQINAINRVERGFLPLQIEVIGSSRTESGVCFRRCPIMEPPIMLTTAALFGVFNELSSSGHQLEFL